MTPEEVREQFIQLLQAEFGYWAGLEDDWTDPLMIRATMIGMGAIANVMAAVAMGTSSEAYRESIKHRHGAQ